RRPRRTTGGPGSRTRPGQGALTAAGPRAPSHAPPTPGTDARTVHTRHPAPAPGKQEGPRHAHPPLDRPEHPAAAHRGARLRLPLRDPQPLGSPAVLPEDPVHLVAGVPGTRRVRGYAQGGARAPVLLDPVRLGVADGAVRLRPEPPARAGRAEALRAHAGLQVRLLAGQERRSAGRLDRGTAPSDLMRRRCARVPVTARTAPAGPAGGGRSLGRVQELHDAPLAPLTTLRLGGPAARLVTATTDDEVISVVC